MKQLTHLVLAITFFIGVIIAFDACKKKEDNNQEGGETGSVTDLDGIVYKTIKIGDQWWMAENLKTKRYADGTTIQLVESNSDWKGLDFSDKAYCYFDNSPDNGNTYGALYTWSAVMNVQSSSNNPSGVRGVCPNGWHVPNDAEWKQLETYLGMSQSEANSNEWRGTNEGSKLAGNGNLWDNDVLESDPEFGTSGFSALPAGSRFSTGKFTRTKYAGFWTSTETDSLYAMFRELGYYNSHTPEEKRNGVRRNGSGLKLHGTSVRCIKD